MAECCATETKLIYACSGASDVGEIADLVARRLRDKGVAGMSCLAGVGAELSGYVQSAIGTDMNITIDGCKTACAKKTLERIGVKPTSYILTGFGLVKGETPVTDKIIAEISGKIKSTIGTPASLEQMVTGGCPCGGKC
jgi:uncharacterized metal-binding protein